MKGHILMQSKATTVAQYLAELPADRRAAIDAVRQVFRKNLDKDFEEGMQYGMIGYYLPHRIYRAGYHCDPKQPLPFACLASQKHYMTLHLMCLYGSSTEAQKFQSDWAETGKKLDMGKACIRFRKVDDLALEVIANTLRRMNAKRYIAMFEAVIAGSRATAKAGQARHRSRPKRQATRNAAQK